MSNASEIIMDIIRSTADDIAVSYSTDLLLAKVVKSDPLEIRLEDKYTVGEEFIWLTSGVKETWIKIPTEQNHEHVHTMEERLVDYTATGNMGAPIIFVPSGIETFIPNPDFDSSKPATDDDIPGAGDNPREKLNPAIPNPTTLPLKHAHTINPALPKIMLWRGLREGDTVIVLRMNRGQMHVILERIEGATNEEEE